MTTEPYSLREHGIVPVTIVGSDGQESSATFGITEAALDSAGGICFPNRFANVLTYNADGTVNTIAFTDGTNTWTQTFTYTSGKVTGISAWVKS